MHHIKQSNPVTGELTTYCDQTGCRSLGGGIDIKGKWSNITTSTLANHLSCKKCIAALPQPPSIYTDLKRKLDREPTNDELVEACAQFTKRNHDKKARDRMKKLGRRIAK